MYLRYFTVFYFVLFVLGYSPVDNPEKGWLKYKLTFINKEIKGF